MSVAGAGIREVDLRRRTLFAYALPAVPLAALGLPLYSLVPTYYTETLGLPIAAVGWVLLIIRIVDAVADPLAGYIADRIHPSFGRRRLLFVLALAPTALGALMLYWPPEDAGLGWLWAFGTLASVGFTFVLVPYSAWGAELVDDYHGRTRLTAAREAMTLVGTLIAIALPFSIGFQIKGFSGLAALGVTASLLLMSFGTLAVLAVPESRDVTRAQLGLHDALRQLSRNRPFLRLLVAYFVNGLANGIPATLFLYFVSARLDLPAMRGPLLFLYFLCAIAGVPLSTWLGRRLGKHRAWSLAMLFACAVFALAPFLAAGALVAFSLICAATGLMLGFDLTLPPSIQADVIDADTAASGDQRSGFYFAAWGLATKLSLAAGAGLVFPLLAAFDFDPAPQARNTDDALLALATIYAWIPVGLKLLAIGLMWNFPIDEKEQMRLRASIAG